MQTSCYTINMKKRSAPKLNITAQKLRKGMTKEERKLWFEFLRDYHLPVKRQAIFEKYIADFYCAAAKLVIELDGSQHYMPEKMENDENRTAFLRKYGLTVIRISNTDINNRFTDICRYIDEEIRKRIDI